MKNIIFDVSSDSFRFQSVHCFFIMRNRLPIDFYSQKRYYKCSIFRNNKEEFFHENSENFIKFYR